MEEKKKTINLFSFLNMDTKKLNIEKIIYIIIMTVMILIPLLKFSTYVPSIARLYIKYFEVKRVYVLWIAIVFLLITYLYLLFSKKVKLGIVDVIIYVLIILAFLSTKYAIDFEKAFFGEQYRYEGLLTILSYYFLLLNSKSIKQEKYKRNIINLFIFIGVIQSVYAFLQSYTNFNFIRRYSIGYMAMGLCSNPNFFGSYMVMQLLLVGYMYIYNPKKKYLILFILFGITLYLAESTGPVLSVLISLIFSLFIIKKKIKRIIKLTFILILSFVFANLTLKYIQINKFNNEFKDEYDISTEITTVIQKPTEQFANGRIIVWKNSIPLVKKYWLLGCGLDNFAKAYPNYGNVKYDKAHNVYLQISVTNGIPALIIFLVLLFIVFIKGIKFNDSNFTPMYMAFIGYSVQAFLNISVIDVAPYYYVFIGLLLSSDYKNREKNIS